MLVEVTKDVRHTLTAIDISGNPELESRFGLEVPVLFINGRKAFKYRVTARELRKKLKRQGTSHFWSYLQKKTPQD